MPMNDSVKILILEDDPADVELLQRELKKAGLQFIAKVVQEREPFEQALDDFAPGIILADYSLPKFDGVTAFRLKQEKYPDIPFIIVSGTIGEENAVELIKSGVTDYALKDKLFTLPPKILRALKDHEDWKAKQLADEKIRMQNEKLFEIAYLQSHEVRGPVAQIIGLANLINFDNFSDPENAAIISNLKEVTHSLDQIIHIIVQKTYEINSA